MNWESIKEWSGWITSSILIVAAIFDKFFGKDAIGKRLIEWLLEFLKSTFGYKRKMWEMVARLEHKIDEVAKEVKFNGGSSTKDVVVKSAAKLDEIAAQVSGIVAKSEINEQRSKEMLFEVDRQVRCTFINSAFLKRFGWLDTNILGFEYENVIHPDDVAESQSKWKLAIERGSKFTDEQRIKNNHTGNYEKCLVEAYPISENGQLKIFSGTIDIIT